MTQRTIRESMCPSNDESLIYSVQSTQCTKYFPIKLTYCCRNTAWAGFIIMFQVITVKLVYNDHLETNKILCQVPTT